MKCQSMNDRSVHTTIVQKIFPYEPTQMSKWSTRFLKFLEQNEELSSKPFLGKVKPTNSYYAWRFSYFSKWVAQLIIFKSKRSVQAPRDHGSMSDEVVGASYIEKSKCHSVPRNEISRNFFGDFHEFIV